MADAYRKIQGRQYAQLPQRLTSENRFWRTFKTVALEQQIGPVTCINFSPAAPGDVAVTTSTRVLIYDANTARVKSQLTKFKDVVYSGTFRSDGKLLVAGGESGVAQVFEMGTKGVLRKLEGHARPVHAAVFSPLRTQIMTASDDKQVKWWDLATGQNVTTFSEHEDYVRCAVAGTDLWLSGSYDHTVKLWDMRTKKSVLTLDHGSQVEAVQMFASGGVLISAGGTELKVWDVLSGGRLLHSAANHQKTVQTLCLHEESSRLMSGGLDGQLKVYDTTDYKVTQNMKFPAPILAQQLSPDRKHLVVGMLSGLLAIRRRSEGPVPDKEQKRDREQKLSTGSYRYFMRGRAAEVPAGAHLAGSTGAGKKVKLKEWDVYLKKFQYQNALDAVVGAGTPLMVVSVVEELDRRDGLQVALRGRNSATLEPFLRFVVNHIANPRYSGVLLSVANILLDIYQSVIGRSATIDALLKKLSDKVKTEIELQQRLIKLQGLMEMLLAGTTAMHVTAGEGVD